MSPPQARESIIWYLNRQIEFRKNSIRLLKHLSGGGGRGARARRVDDARRAPQTNERERCENQRGARKTELKRAHFFTGGADVALIGAVVGALDEFIIA